MLKIFGAVGSGSVPIEATLTLLGIPHEVIEAVTWEDEAARKRVETVNPLGQVPALVLPSGEIMTEVGIPFIPPIWRDWRKCWV